VCWAAVWVRVRAPARGAGYDPAGRCGWCGCGVAAGRSPAPGRLQTDLAVDDRSPHHPPVPGGWSCLCLSVAARSSRLRWATTPRLTSARYG